MMKSFFKKLAFVMALAMVVSLAAPAATTAAAAEALQIKYQNGVDTPSEINIAKVGAVEDLKFTGAPDYKEAGFEWTSSNPAVATVNQKGEVTAVAAGTAEVTITVGDRQDTVKVNVVDLPTYTATMGINSKDLKTEVTLEVGGEVDFGFFGIKDYDRNRYQCNWFEAGNGSVATVDKNGVIKAIGEGTTVISLGVYNVITGQKHSVASCTVTVGAKATPTPATNPEIVATQKTELAFELSFKDMNVDVEKLAKNEIEVYEYHVDEETGIEHFYIWQINSISVVEDKEDTVWVSGYTSDELKDEQKYVVKYVVPNADEEEVVTIEETSFVASVGAVDRVETSYRSYSNNQNGWTFPNIAYTSEDYGEEIDVDVEYVLYDDENINVTGHYLRANDYKNLVTLELVTEEAEDTFRFFGSDGEATNTIVFDELPETPYVVFNVVYEDEDGNEVAGELKMLVKEAPAYHVTAIDNWQINIIDADPDEDIKSPAAADTFSLLKQWVALYDDYNVDTMVPIENHEIVLWFTDNYGNAYVTNDKFTYGETDTKFNGMKHWAIDGSEKFSNEGYELYFETRSPQTLVVGDEYDDLTTSNIITTKKTGTATVNVTLHNEDGLVDRIDSLKIQVKAARYLKSVKTSSSTVTMTSDSIPTNARVQKDDDRAGDGGKFDTEWTKGTVKLYATDNHGAAFGLYNDTLLKNFDIEVATDYDALTTYVASVDEDNYSSRWGELEYTLYGPEVACAINDTTKETAVTKAEVEITVKDGANEKELKDDFKIVLKEPNYVGVNGISNIKVDEKIDLRADGTYGYVNTPGLVVPIKVVETSNKRDVNYSDKVTLLGVGDSIPSTATTGDMFIKVLDPKGKVIDDAGQFYINTVERGYYEFVYADRDLVTGTRFATTGTYTVKLTTITESGSQITKTEKFKLVDDRFEFSYVDQNYIYVSDDLLEDFDKWKDNGTSDIQEIAADAFSYWNKTWNCGVSFNGWPVIAEIGGVRFTENEDANAVVIKDVFFKVKIDVNCDEKFYEADWYYVEVEIPDGKTVSVESLTGIGTSTKYRLDPSDQKIQ